MNLQIVRGDATPEEIAVLVAVLTARAKRTAARRDGAETSAAGGPWRGGAASGGSGTARSARAGWADRSRGLRAPLAHGPDAWRASGRPG